jgi:ribosomal protein S18 acetylase RimI-like enzyme
MEEIKFTMRIARVEDIHSVFELSNELDVRENSFHHEKIKYRSHKKWFLNKITDNNVLFLVSLVNGDFAGQVRFEITTDESLISLSVVNNFRGKGVGSFLIKEGLKQLKQVKPEVKKVFAYVKEDNKASVRLFKKNGFSLQKKVYVAGQKSFEFIFSMI